MRAYASALDGVKTQPREAGASRTIPGSLDALAVAYYRSPEFLGLKASTASMRRGIIERLRLEHGTKPLNRLGRVHIVNMLGARSATPSAANNFLKILRLLLNYGVSIGMLTTNPANGIKPYKINNDGIHTWSEAEIAQFESKHPVGSKARLAFALLLYTGQRRSDVVGMGFQHVKDNAIAVRQQKTNTQLLIPIHPELAKNLNFVPKDHLTFLLSRYGRPYHVTAFSNWFRDRCDEAGLPDCAAHGLRKACSRRLAEAGCTANEIMAITGHKSLVEVQRYTKAADQIRLARSAMEAQIKNTKLHSLD